MIIIVIISLWLASGFIFSYNIICLPMICGINTFESGMKYDFTPRILNPIMAAHIKTKIIEHPIQEKIYNNQKDSITSPTGKYKWIQ